MENSDVQQVSGEIVELQIQGIFNPKEKLVMPAEK
jgi:hypothetical protein